MEIEEEKDEEYEDTSMPEDQPPPKATSRYVLLNAFATKHLRFKFLQ